MSTRDDLGSTKQLSKMLRPGLQTQTDRVSGTELTEEELKQASGGAVDAFIGSATGGAGSGKLRDGSVRF